MMGDYGVELVNDSMQDFYVNFAGPKGSPYEGGVWKVHVELPEVGPGTRQTCSCSPRHVTPFHSIHEGLKRGG